MGPDLYISCSVYSTVDCFKWFQIKTINREYSFLPTGGVWWAKKFLLQALEPSWRLLPLPARGGVEKICENFEISFIFVLASEERVPKKLKQVSIVGKKYSNYSSIRFLTVRACPGEICRCCNIVLLYPFPLENTPGSKWTVVARDAL